MWINLLMASAIVVFWREMIKFAVIGITVLTKVGAIEIVRVVQ